VGGKGLFCCRGGKEKEQNKGLEGIGRGAVVFLSQTDLQWFKLLPQGETKGITSLGNHFPSRREGGRFPCMRRRKKGVISEEAGILHQKG